MILNLFIVCDKEQKVHIVVVVIYRYGFSTLGGKLPLIATIILIRPLPPQTTPLIRPDFRYTGLAKDYWIIPFNKLHTNDSLW
jgi:hypothetical protein